MHVEIFCYQVSKLKILPIYTYGVAPAIICASLIYGISTLYYIYKDLKNVRD